MAKNKKKIYCVFCGTENDYEAEYCLKCKKTLHPKNSLFKDFLYEHIKDDLKDKVKDNIFSYLKNYLISNLYGTAMSIAIIFTAVVTVSNFTGHYQTVTSTGDIKNKLKSNSNEVTIFVYTYDDSCTNYFDPELADIPFAAAGVISGLRREVQEITVKKGTTINQYCQNDHTDELICTLPVASYDLYKKEIDSAAKKYREKILEYAAWARETGAKDDNEYARRNMELDDYYYEIFKIELTEYDKNKTIKKPLELYVDSAGCL